MKKRILIGALIVIVGIGLVFTMSSCDAIFQSLVESASSVSGTVIDARDENATALSGMSLTLTSVAESTYTQTETTSSDGSFTFDGLDPDKSPYKITGSGDISGTTYTVIPQNVELDGLFKTLGNVPALAIRVADAENYAITYILMWPKTSADNETGRDYDLDLHLSFDITSTNQSTFYYNGDYGNEGTTAREQVYFGAPVYPTSGTAQVEQDVDSKLANTVPGVETISLREIPIAEGNITTDLSSSTGDNDSLSALFEDMFGDDYGPWKWAGYSKAYVDLFDTDPSSTEAKLSDVSPQLYVIQSYFEEGDSIKDQSTAKALLLGVFSLPEMDVVDSASMVRTDLFYDSGAIPAYLIMWDGELYPDGPNDGYTFKSINGQSFIAVSGRQY